MVSTMSTPAIVAWLVGFVLFGFVAGQFVRLPGVGVVCDNALLFMTACVVLSVLVCALNQWIAYRFTIELRFLGEELRQTVNRRDTNGGASA